MELEEVFSIDIARSHGASGTEKIDVLCQVLHTDLDQNDFSRNLQLYLECHDDEANDILLKEQIDSLNKEKDHQMSDTLIKERMTVPRTHLRGSLLSTVRVPCDLCSKSFTRKNLLQDHRSTVHKIMDLFPCSICKYKGQRYRHWFKHMRRMHPEVEVILGQGVSDINLSKLSEEHITDSCISNKITTNTKKQASCSHEQCTPGTDLTVNNQQCQICGKVFKNMLSLRYHSRIHVEKTHVCLIPGCRKLFKNSSALNEHRATVHGVHVYRCPEKNCSKTYALQRDLSYHHRVHTGTYRCNVNCCNKVFRDHYALTLHLKTHTGEKNLKCEYCRYTCIQKSALKLHKQRKHREKLL